MLKRTKEGKLKLQAGKAFKLEEIMDAHLTIEENRAGGRSYCSCEPITASRFFRVFGRLISL